MKQQYEIGIRLSDDLLRRLLYISEAENRSPSAEIAFLLRNNAAYFERAKGKIDTKKLASYDLTPYRVEERPRTGETDGASGKATAGTPGTEAANREMSGDVTGTESTIGKAPVNAPGAESTNGKTPGDAAGAAGEREGGNGNP